MAELKGRRLALDDGGRPRVDDAGRLVYVDADASKAAETRAVKGQGVHTTRTEAEARKDPENSTVLEPANAGADDTTPDTGQQGS